MEFDQALPGEFAQPGRERQRSGAKVLGKVLDRFGKSFLHDVGRVHARGQPAIQSDSHLPQAPRWRTSRCARALCVSLAGLFDQFLGVRRGCASSSGSPPSDRNFPKRKKRLQAGPRFFTNDENSCTKATK